MGSGEKIKAQVLGGQIEKRGVGLRQRKVLLAEYLTRWEKKQGREVARRMGGDMKWLQKGKNIVLNYIYIYINFQACFDARCGRTTPDATSSLDSDAEAPGAKSAALCLLNLLLYLIRLHPCAHPN